MSEPFDDAYIIAVGRTVMQRGGELQFDEATPVEEGFKVTAMLKASITVKLQEEIAHGRKLALQMLEVKPCP